MSDSHSDQVLRPLRVILTQTFEDQLQETFDLRFSPDGNTLLSSDGNAVYFWELEAQGKWKQQKRISCFAVAPRFAPDGKMFVYRNQEQTLHLSTLEGKELAAFPYGNQTNVDCAFSPDQRWLVSGDSRGQLIFWDISTSQAFSVADQMTFHVPWKEAQWTPSFHQFLQESISSANHFLFTPDGQRIVFVGANDEGYIHICRFDGEAIKIEKEKTLPLRGITDQKISPDGKLLAVSSEGKIFIYEMNLFHQIATFVDEGETNEYTRVAFSPDSQFLVSCTYDGNVDIWSLRTFKQMVSFAAHPGLDLHSSDSIGGLDWSCTNYIATGGSSYLKHYPDRTDYTVKLWKVVFDQK